MRQAQRGASKAAGWTKHGEAMCTDNPHPVPLSLHIARYTHNLSEKLLLRKATSYVVIFAEIILLCTSTLHYALVRITTHCPINTGV
jgi:aspartate/glutamate racemase